MKEKKLTAEEEEVRRYMDKAVFPHTFLSYFLHTDRDGNMYLSRIQEDTRACSPTFIGLAGKISSDLADEGLVFIRGACVNLSNGENDPMEKEVDNYIKQVSLPKTYHVRLYFACRAGADNELFSKSVLFIEIRCDTKSPAYSMLLRLAKDIRSYTEREGMISTWMTIHKDKTTRAPLSTIETTLDDEDD